jgi:hypothetical protein
LSVISSSIARLSGGAGAGKAGRFQEKMRRD